MQSAVTVLGRSALFISLALGACPALSQVTKENLKVTGIRAYTDGNLHIFFNKKINSACGEGLRVPRENGQDAVRAVALSAMMSGRVVAVESASVPSGKFCNLTYIRMNDQ